MQVVMLGLGAAAGGWRLVHGMRSSFFLLLFFNFNGLRFVTKQWTYSTGGLVGWVLRWGSEWVWAEAGNGWSIGGCGFFEKAREALGCVRFQGIWV